MLINEHINVNELSQFLYDNITFEMFFEFCVIYFFIIWIALVVWVIKDISNRTNNIFMHIFSLFLIVAFTPIFWFFLYLMIRPSHTLFEQHYEVIESNFDILADILADHQTKVHGKQKNDFSAQAFKNTSISTDNEIKKTTQPKRNLKIEAVLKKDVEDILSHTNPY